MRVFIFIKKNIFAIFFSLFAICLVIFSSSNLTATKNGLALWANNVVPSLFPFMVAANLLGATNIVYILSKYLDKFMRPIFNVPGCSAFPFIMGLISGYPVGAKIVSNLYASGECTKEEAERMLCFTNNSGPLFILGYCGLSLYGNSHVGALLLFTHILSSIIVGIFLGIFSRKKSRKTFGKVLSSGSSENYKSNNKLNLTNISTLNRNSSNVSFSNLGEILGNSIISSVKTILMIGGFVTLFSVIISILKRTKIITLLSQIISSLIHIKPEIINGLFIGFIEFTNGLSEISNIHLKSLSTNLTLSAFVLGFGGISVTLQVLSIISKYKLSGRKYLYGKLLHGLVAGIITLVLLKIPLLNLDL